MTSVAPAPLRVLVVEDNPDHRFLLIRALRQVAADELEISEAHNGEQALDCLHGRGPHAGSPLPHLVFLDLRMPRLGGLEVLQDVKRNETLSEIPVVVVTSSDRQEDVDAAYRLGSNSYVTKSGEGSMHDLLPRLAEYWTQQTKLPTPPSRQRP